MDNPFSTEEVRILKKICENPIFKKSKPFHVEKPKRLKVLIQEICDHYDISEKNFLSNRRDVDLIKARKEFVHHASKINRCSSSKIARAMNRDHSTVCYYLKQPSYEVDRLLQSFNDSKEND